LRLEADGAIMVHANRELVSQALANLVDNAVKYSDEGAERPQVVISVGRKGGAVVLGVADNGAGIGEADRLRVVDRFVRLEESRSKPGSGLGLSLVSAVAKLHGGKLLLRDNRPGLAAILEVPASAAGNGA
jgi:signal transduction histidine kinase